MWRLSIAVFYTIARASSISFHLHQQFFVDTKIFALEWLFMTQYISYCLPVFLFFSNKIFVFLCMLSFQKQEYISFFSYSFFHCVCYHIYIRYFLLSSTLCTHSIDILCLKCSTCSVVHSGGYKEHNCLKFTANQISRSNLFRFLNGKTWFKILKNFHKNPCYFYFHCDQPTLSFSLFCLLN